MATIEQATQQPDMSKLEQVTGGVNPAPPVQASQRSPFLRTPMPIITASPDSLRQFYGDDIPQFRVVPPPVAGTPGPQGPQGPAGTSGTSVQTFVTPISSSGGTGIQLNGSQLSDPNFNGAVPAAPTGTVNVTFQKDSSIPANVSAYADLSTCEKLAHKDAVNGYAGLDGSGLLKTAEMPGLPAAQITSGQLAVARGGTGSDLSATGGASQVLKQTTAGGGITVGTISTQDLLGAVVQDLTSQSAAITAATLVALVPPGSVTAYRVAWTAKVTTAAGTTSTLGGMSLSYTDPDGVAVTLTCPAYNQAGSSLGSGANSGNTTGTVSYGYPVLLACKAGTTIQYTFSYASNPAAAMRYSLHIRLEEL